MRFSSSFVGGYHLELKYNDSKTDLALLTLVSCFSPEDAVSRMKALLVKRQSSSDRLSSEPEVLTSADEPLLNQSNDDGVDGAESLPVMDNGDTSAESGIPSDITPVQQTTLNNTARATLLIEEGLVQFDPKTKVFTVRSLDHHRVHAVHMNDPKRLFRCSCPSQLQTCSHILAIKLFLGNAWILS